MELNGDKVSECHGRCENHPVFGCPYAQLFVCRLRIVAVNEIELAAGGNVPKNRVIVLKSHGIPTHMRNLEKIPTLGAYFIGEPPHFAGKDSKTGGLVFLAEVKEHLEAYANAQYGYSGIEPFPDERMKAEFPQTLHRFSGRSHTGKDHLVRLPDLIMGIGNQAWKPKMVHCALHTGQVPGFVVKYRNHASALLL
jgi:hypothetical protein